MHVFQFTNRNIFVKWIHQHKYIKDLIALANVSNSRNENNHSELNVKYNKEEGSLVTNPILPIFLGIEV